MIITTTCDKTEFEAIRARALEIGLQVTAAPGFIYKKGNWIVGGTLENEAHFNARVESKSLTPAQFLGALEKATPIKRSLFIVCDNEKELQQVCDHFTRMGYTQSDRYVPGFCVRVLPADKNIMPTSEEVARQNEKDNGYLVIDFDTFNTIVG